MNSKIMNGFLGFFLLIMASGSCHALNVDVGGWTFTTDVEGWRFSEKSEVTDGSEIYDVDSKADEAEDAEFGELFCSVKGTWKGVAIAFDYPAYPNAPKDNDEYSRVTGYGTIYVLKVPEDLRAELQDRDVAVYGSIDKIPEDASEEEMNAILKDATRYSPWCKRFENEEDTDFNDKKAHLSTGDPKGESVGTIAVLLDDNTVGIIDIHMDKNPGYGDKTYFDGSAEDVIDSFTISPK